MSHISDDRVIESTTTTGTGALTLAGALTGFRAFGAVMTSPSDTCFYALWAVDGSGNATGDYEEGLGTYSAANTLTRTTVLRSSNSNAAVSLSAGTKYVAIGMLAIRTASLDNELSVPLPLSLATLNPATPASGFVSSYFQAIAGKPTPKYIDQFASKYSLQDKLSEGNGVLYFPNNGTTVGLNLGIGWTTGGTVSHPTTASTNVYTQQRRTRWANVVTTANQVLGLRTATAEKCFLRGSAARVGGFNFHARFAIGLWAAASVRLFVGLNDSNTGWVVSDTLTGNGCGFWHDAADAATVLSFVTRDGTTATKASVGTLAASLAAGQVYDAWIWTPPNASTIKYRLVELNTNTLIVEGSTSTNIPTNTALMGPELAMSNAANTTVTTTAFELMRMSCQSDL